MLAAEQRPYNSARSVGANDADRRLTGPKKAPTTGTSPVIPPNGKKHRLVGCQSNVPLQFRSRIQKIPAPEDVPMQALTNAGPVTNDRVQVAGDTAEGVREVTGIVDAIVVGIQEPLTRSRTVDTDSCHDRRRSSLRTPRYHLPEA